MCDIWTFTDVSCLRSSIGQFDPPIGWLEGFEGCSAKVMMTLWRASRDFESFEVAQRESITSLVRSWAPTERCDDSSFRVTRVLTDCPPMLDPQTHDL